MSEIQEPPVEDIEAAERVVEYYRAKMAPTIPDNPIDRAYIDRHLPAFAAVLQVIRTDLAFARAIDAGRAIALAKSAGELVGSLAESGRATGAAADAMGRAIAGDRRAYTELVELLAYAGITHSSSGPADMRRGQHVRICLPGELSPARLYLEFFIQQDGTEVFIRQYEG